MCEQEVYAFERNTCAGQTVNEFHDWVFNQVRQIENRISHVVIKDDYVTLHVDVPEEPYH